MKNNENVRTNLVSYIMGKARNWRNQECNANPEGDLWEKKPMKVPKMHEIGGYGLLKKKCRST